MKLLNANRLRLTSAVPIDVFLVLSFVVPFAIYMATLAPSVTFFDSGEFITAVSCLGSAHSPGYPLFLMYAKPFTWLPLGNIAFRVNVATAASSSLACMGVYFLVVYLLKSDSITSNSRFSHIVCRLAGFSAALVFCVTPRLWLQSNHDKPYPLLAFISAVILYLILKWREEYANGCERPAIIYACTFLAGLSTALHQSIILLLPAWFLLIVLTDLRMMLRVKELVISLACALLGFAVHLYLPIRALQNPILNWGDAKTLNQFLWHFLRKGYPQEPHGRDLKLLWLQVKAFNLTREFTWLGVILLLFGMVYLWRRHKAVCVAYVVSVAVFLLYIAGVLNTMAETIFLTEEFFTPLYLLTAVFVGCGLYGMLQFVVARSKLPNELGGRIYVVVAVMFLVLPSTLCAVNYYENDQHNNYIAFDYATNSLRSLPQNAVMFTWGDSGAFPLWYLQGVERMREDLDLPHTPHLVFTWYQDTMPRLFKDSNLRKYDLTEAGLDTALRIAITETLNSRPTFVDFSTRYSVEFNEYVPVQRGIVYRVRKISEPSGLPDVSVWDNYNNRGILDRISFLDLDTGKAILIYANSYIEAGEFLMGIGKHLEGRAMMQKAVQIAPEMKSSMQQVLLRYGYTY